MEPKQAPPRSHAGGMAAVTTALSSCFFRQSYLEEEAKTRNRAIWCRPEQATGTSRFPLAEQMSEIVARCPELQVPSYVPPCWAAGSYGNVILHLIKDKVSTWLNRGPPLHREHLTASDGGKLSIDYSDDPKTRGLPEDAPVVIVLHTITGSGPSMTWFLREACARGWRGCVLNRRGAAEPLATPRFNLLGSVEDTQLQVEAVRQRFPQAFLGMVGISAGSGLLVSYLGTVGTKTPVRSACCICPAYDITKAFIGVYERHPKADAYLLKNLKDSFIMKNYDVLVNYNPQAVQTCMQTKSMHEFLVEHWPFTGAKDANEYFKFSNPMEHVDGISMPILLLNSEDDMVCLPENIRDDIPATNGGGILIRTSRGSHCAFCEGATGGGSYLNRLTMDFLEASYEVGTHAVDVTAK